MNDDDRGFSPWANHVAEIVPPEGTRGRERRERFFSTAAGTGRGGRGAAFGETLCAGAGGLAAIFAAGRPLAAGRIAGFGGFVAGRFGTGLAFLTGRFDAAFARAGRGIAFFTKRLRVLAAVFFPCALAIVKKEWRSIAAVGPLVIQSRLYGF